MLRGVLGETRGDPLSTQVTNEDGTESDLIDHLVEVHQKGTKGFTDEYLASLHTMLHQRKRDPLPEHTHPIAEMIPAQAGPVDAQRAAT
jgi:hypothetical protein